MAIGIIAQIGIGIVASIVQSMVTDAIKGSDAKETAAEPAPASKVTISDTVASLKKSGEATSAAEMKTPVDQLFVKAPDSVKKAWEKTKEDLGLDTGNKSYYMNEMTVVALMAQAGLNVGFDEQGHSVSPGGFFGANAASAVNVVDAVINRLSAPVSGYDQNAKERQAALEMYTTFKQHLMQA